QSDTPETHQAIQQFVQAVKAQYPQTLFVGEVWSGADVIAPYLNRPGELDLAFHFPLSAALIDSLRAGNSGSYLGTLNDSLHRIASQDKLAPFVTNHDMVRLPSQLG